jgi:hypothetical protein
VLVALTGSRVLWSGGGGANAPPCFILLINGEASHAMSGAPVVKMWQRDAVSALLDLAHKGIWSLESCALNGGTGISPAGCIFRTWV